MRIQGSDYKGICGNEVLLPLPRQKFTKIERKTAYKLSLIGRGYYRYREKIQERAHPLSCFFAAEVP